MKCFKNRYNNLSYIIFTILSLFSISLIFNNNVWFDEAYTLSLIQHNYSEVIEILKSDMHPPLYFISLKFFCEIFGYSILVTKIFRYSVTLQRFCLAVPWLRSISVRIHQWYICLLQGQFLCRFISAFSRDRINGAYFLLHFALRKLCCFLKITGRGIALYLLSPLCLPRTTTFTLCLRSA